jgi:cell division septation protein DedD
VNRKHLIIAALLFGVAAPVGAQTVQSGIEAWQHSDYDTAVKIWRPLAEQGDPDAQFNLAQAYRLGRGVSTNLAAAQIWLERAAVQGHVDAQTTLGLLLFQSGDRSSAVKWLKAAADKDDPRALLVYGTALFNGDTVTQNAALGYSYVARAAAQGLAPAKATLAQMNQVMSAKDRTKALALIAEQKVAPKASGATEKTSKIVAEKPEIKPTSTKVAAAEKAKTKKVAEKAEPAKTTPEAQSAAKPHPEKTPVKSIAEKASPVKKPTVSAPASVKAGGSWRIQLGAFSQRSSAEGLFRKLSGSAPVSGRSAFYSANGAMTRLQIGPFASKSGADEACRSLSSRGQPCFPVPGK